MQLRYICALVIGITLSACTISESVNPVKDTAVREVCIQNNSSVQMSAFEPTLKRLIEEQGVKTKSYSGNTPPNDCSYTLTYTANWRWDLAIYLFYARIEVFNRGRSVGMVEYDARRGGANMNKFGRTEAKLRPLIQRLFPKS